MKKVVLLATLCIIGTSQLVYSQPANGLPDFEDAYVKRNVALVDAYVRSITQETFVRELFFKNFGSEALPTVVGFRNDIFTDDGTRNDAVAGDGVYTSADAYAHTSTVLYTGLKDVSVSPDYSVVDNSFEFKTALEEYLQTYTVLEYANAASFTNSTNALMSLDEWKENSNNLFYNVVNSNTMRLKKANHLLTSVDEFAGNSIAVKKFKIKALLTCDVGGCSCAECHCRACDHSWGQSLNWCFYVKNCHIEIGWD